MDKLSVFVFLVILYRISALKIVDPHPENKVLVEGVPLMISCSFADSSDYPTVIFQRRLDGIVFEDINKTNERVHVTNSTRNTSEGYVTTAVLHFTSVMVADDTDRAPWQCKAISALRTDKQGFTIYVVPKVDLPKATIGGGGTIQYGETVTLICNVTDGKSYSAPLKGLWWVKDGKVLKNGTANTIQHLVITKATSSNGGEYHCTGVIKLKTYDSYLEQMVLAKTILNIKLKIAEGITKVKGSESGDVTMECPADGYPLNVTWMRVNREGQEISLDSNRSVVTRACSSCRFKLTISNLQPRDQGRYVCKATGLGSAGRHSFDLSFSQGHTTTVKPTVGLTVGPTVESSAVIYGVQSFWVLLAGMVTLLVA